MSSYLTETQTCCNGSTQGLCSKVESNSLTLPKISSKTPKAVVQRSVCLTEESSKFRRVITIHYEYDRINFRLCYGASVFRSERKNTTKSKGHFLERCDKEGHRRTAKTRFEKDPVIVTGVQDTTTLREFNEQIRKYLFKHGVQARRVVEQVQDTTKQEDLYSALLPPAL